MEIRTIVAIDIGSGKTRIFEKNYKNFGIEHLVFKIYLFVSGDK